MKNKKALIAIIAAIVVIAAALLIWQPWKKPVEQATTPTGTTAPATTSNLTFTTGGAAGTYYAFGTVLANYVSNNTDVKVTAVVGNGSADNIDALDIGDAQLAFVQNDVANYAFNGIRFERYEGKPITGFRAIASLYTEAVQLATCNPDIKTMEDLRGKNVSIGAVGSGVYFNALDFLAAYGMTVDDINPQYLNFADSAESLKDGKIDAAFIVSGAPTTAIADLFSSKQSYLISLDDAAVAKLQEISGAYTKTVIPAGTYSNQAEDVVTVGIKATIIANNKVSDEQAYTIVKAIFENKAAITEAHAKGAELDLDYASTCGLPYHAGAAKYFTEKGITVEAKPFE